MLLKIHPDTPSHRQILKVVETLRNGGVIIYPTDSVYGIGCDINNKKAIEKVAQFKGVKMKKAKFSFIFCQINGIAEFTKPIARDIFKLMKKNLPGPFTFILPASKKVPKILENSRKNLGIRIPDNNIVRDIVRELGNPIITTSVLDENEIIEYTIDPELIYDKYKNKVDIVINGGYGNNEASTVVDCTGDELEIVRQGITELVS